LPSGTFGLIIKFGEKETLMVDTKTPYLMIVEAQSYPDIVQELSTNAIKVFEDAGVEYECLKVPTEYEIPAAVAFAVRGHEFYSRRRRFDGYVALGCVIENVVPHYDTHYFVECIRGLQNLTTEHALALGNGVYTCQNMAQATEWARKNSRNIGGHAAQTALSMLDLKQHFGMKPR